MKNAILPDSLRDTIKKHRQDHLIKNWDQLCEQTRARRLRCLLEIDFPQVSRLIDLAMSDSAKSDSSGIKKRISPLQQVVRLPKSADDKDAWQLARKEGLSILDSGQVGAILVAGGQGSRLGFPYPKGMYPIGPVSDRTLFQIFFEQLLALSNRHNVSIPYFIMTSDATHDETEQFLESHCWFGYPPEDVFLFRQGKLPAVDASTGKILLAEQGEIAMSPDGHGGLLQAMKKAGLLKEMQKRGIDYLYYHQVDNPCASLCDPAMLGFHVAQQAEMSTKVVSKRTAEEKVGIVAEVDSLQQIIEYSNFDDDLAGQQDSLGQLVYWAGNIAVHLFNRSLLERLTRDQENLPVHIAHKKVEHLNEQGELISPDQPNAYKFEQFIFDAIPKAANPLVIEADRESEFNPVKNATGDDSPTTAKSALSQRGRNWLQQAGIKTQPEAIVEISPLMALDPEDLHGLSLPDYQKDCEILITPDLDED